LCLKDTLNATIQRLKAYRLIFVSYEKSITSFSIKAVR